MTPLKLRNLRAALAALLLFSGAAYCGATTVTVGPTGMYQDPCVAFAHLNDGDTVTIDANGGTPYYETAAEGQDDGQLSGQNSCIILNNNITISGVNGRPIIDGTQANVQKGLWLLNGHDIVVDNIEFREGYNNDGNSSADAVRIQPGTAAAPAGGNVTFQHCYIHDSSQGILVDNAGTNTSGVDIGEWYSSSPYVMLQYDEFAFGGGGGTSPTGGLGHNIYDGYDTNLSAPKLFTLQYSWSHDALYGHTARCRSPQCNIYYNLLDDTWGKTSFELDITNGAKAYVVGNVIYKSPVTDPNANKGVEVAFREASSNSGEPVYEPSYQDLHFINNTVIHDSGTTAVDKAFISEECLGQLDATNCPSPLPADGPPLTVPGVFENNIFIGYPPEITNDLTGLVENNVSYLSTAPTPAVMAPLDFANPAALDFHIASGSQAIGYGIYPPTDNQGNADMKAYAQYQYSPPMLQGAARPTPSGSTMDAGAFSYPPPTAPSLNLTYTHTVTDPGTGTITVSGLPTPPAGQFNYVAFWSTNTSAIPYIPTVTGTTSVSTTFSTLPVASSTVVPINIYADGTILTANVTVNPGSPIPYEITRDGPYSPATTIHLEGPAPAGGTVVTLSSNSSYLYSPASVTVPQGAITAEDGTLNGALWGQSPNRQPVTLTASAGGTQVQLSFNLSVFGIYQFSCVNNPCAAAVGGQPYTLFLTTASSAPYGGYEIPITSSNPAVIPNQYYDLAAGSSNPPLHHFQINTNAVSSPQTVTLTMTINGSTTQDIDGKPATVTITVNPGDAPASVTVVSGSGQSANTGTPFTNPLVVLVTDSSSNPLSGVLVTFSGTNVSFPSGNTATTGSNGEASVTAEPTATGSLTIDGTVSGVSSPAVFSETGTSPVAISSITRDTTYGPGTTVHLTAAAPTGGAVVTLSSSNSSVGYIPSTVTVPSGQTSAETGSFLGTLWGQSPTHQSITFTGTDNGTAQLTFNMGTPYINQFSCNGGCTVTGGSNITMTSIISAPGAPYGNGTMTFTSSNTAVIPNQSVVFDAGQTRSVDGSGVPLTTNAVSTTTTVTLTAGFNGSSQHQTITVNP